MLLCSDGLPEAADAAGEPLGYEAVRRLVAGAAGGAADTVAGLAAAVARRSDGGAPADDVTLVAVLRTA